MRVKFEKGKQREFLKEVLKRANSPSLRELRKRGLDVSYSTFKNYYNEDRTLPLDLFEQLLVLSNLNRNDFDFEILDDNWGRIKGGKKSRKLL